MGLPVTVGKQEHHSFRDGKACTLAISILWVREWDRPKVLPKVYLSKRSTTSHRTRRNKNMYRPRVGFKGPGPGRYCFRLRCFANFDAFESPPVLSVGCFSTRGEWGSLLPYTDFVGSPNRFGMTGPDWLALGPPVPPSIRRYDWRPRVWGNYLEV